MNRALNIPNDIKVKAFYLFYILISVQIGVGITGYPKLVFVEAKKDSWISLIIAVLIVHIIIACIIYILNSYDNTDLYGILEQSFGKIIGRTVSFLFIIYLVLAITSIYLNFIEIVKVFLFSRLSDWVPTLMVLLLMIYSILGGFRAVVGTCFVLFFSTIWMILLLYEPMRHIDFLNYAPIFEASLQDIASGTLVSAYSILGFEVLWFLYPFIIDKKNITRYSQLGAFLSGLLLFLALATSIGFFSATQLEENIWPLLQMFKNLSFPLFERFDIIVVGLWLLIILSNVVILGWVITFGLRRITKFKQKHYLYILSSLIFLSTFYFDERQRIVDFTDFSAKLGLFFAFLLPILLLPFAIIRRRKGKKNNA